MGFNKILLCPLKLSNITSFVCDPPGSVYFRTTKIVPPNPNKQTVLVRKANDEDIKAAYQEQYSKFMKTVTTGIDENAVKKELFTAKLPDNVPPLSLILKDNKLTFIEFVSKFLGEDTSNIIL